MKKLLVLLLFSEFFFQSIAQKSILVNTNFEPLHSYHCIGKKYVNIDLDYRAADSILSRMRKKDSCIPVQNSIKREIDEIFSIGEIKDSICSIEMKAVNVIDNWSFNTETSVGGDNGGLPSGTIFRGTYKPGQEPNYNQVIIDGSNDNYPSAEISTLKGCSVNLFVPDKKMIMGDVYIQHFADSFRVLGGILKIDQANTYTLVSIDHDSACFDIKINVLLSGITPKIQSPFNGSGEGTGKLVYNMKTGCITREQMNYTSFTTADYKPGVIITIKLDMDNSISYTSEKTGKKKTK